MRPVYDGRRMGAPETKAPGPPGKGRLVVVAGVIGLLFAGAAGWKGWQLFVEEPRRAEAALRAFDVTPAAKVVPAPPILGYTPEGKPFTLADARGQVVFVNFWATWCPPCREEMPSMLQLGRELASRHPGKFRMVAVSVDVGWPEVRQFFAGRLPQGIDVLLDPEQVVTKEYYCLARGGCPDSFKFPETYVVDASGKLVSFVIGPRDWSDPAALRYLERLFP
jgi:thiol-disulfide isomerase/thioredoxin